MQLAVNVSLPNILTLISQMSLNEIEEVKNKIVEKELYFKTFKKDPFYPSLNTELLEPKICQYTHSD